MLVDPSGNLRFIHRPIFDGELAQDVSITYEELIVVRHSSSAYQIYLQINSDVDGRTIEMFEVFVEDASLKVFQETIVPPAD